jgi:hypothetical protein
MAALLGRIIMRIRRTFLGLLFATLVSGVGALASGRTASEPKAVLTNAISRLDHDALLDMDGPALMADLIAKEYGAREEELKPVADQKLGWGDIAALAYIQSVTGKSLTEMVHENAQLNFWAYAENAGMNCEKMARSLESFVKQAERERNTKIFDRLRASRRVHPVPDLGSGFGLFQEALDFRHIDIPQPTKIHDLPGELAKGGQ